MVSCGGAAGAARLRAMCGAATLCDGDAGSPGGAGAEHPLARERADTFRVRSSRACWNRLARADGAESQCEMRLLSQERSNLGVIESRMVKLAWKFMSMQACGDCSLIASVLQER